MNTYLVVSDSYKLLDEEVYKIISKFSNVIKYDLRKSSLKDVINEANYFSFVDHEKCIVVNSNDLFKSQSKEYEEDLLFLEKYFESPNEKCTLVFKSSLIPDKRKKIYKKIENTGKIIIIPSLNKKELTYKCIDLLKNNGYFCDYETANYIVENSYSNYDILTNELDKIYLLKKAGRVTQNDIKDIISKSLNGNVYSYISAVLEKDLKKAIHSSKNFSTLKIDPFMVIIMLAKEYEMLLLVMVKGNSAVQKLYHKENWQMNNYIKYSYNYKINEVKKIIIKLNNYDYRLKSGKVDKDVILDLIALDICD